MRCLQRVSVVIFHTPCTPHPHLILHTKVRRERERETEALCQVRGQRLDYGHNCGKQYALCSVWRVVTTFYSSGRSGLAPTERCAQSVMVMARNYARRIGTYPCVLFYP